jgi:hypothetical protein
MKFRSAPYFALIVALLVANFSLYILNPSETQAANSNFAVTAAASLSQVTQGDAVGLSLMVKNTSSKKQTLSVVLSVTDQAGTVVYNKVWANQDFTRNKSVTFSTSYATAANAATGTYRLGVKLQNSAGTAIYYSDPAAASFSVIAPVLLPAPTPAPAPTPTPTPAPAPSSSPIYWGVYMDGVPWDLTKLSTFESSVNKGASIVHFGQPWMHSGQYYNFPTTLMESIRLHGSLPMINWGSWDYCCGTDQSAWKLSNIYNGTYDAFIQQWANSARAWGHPFFMRFDHEMNGWWQFPWSEQVNGNQPGDYVKAWKHVHDIFTQAGATNVTWVWAPNIIGPNTTPLASLYPGDTYVDWLAMDGYNWGLDNSNVWQSFSQVFAPTYSALTQLAPGKPIMLAETASSENGGSKAAWITDAMQTQLPANFPMIKALVWFNWDAGNSTLSWPINSSQAALDAFKSAVGSSYYAANTFASLKPAAIPASPPVQVSVS